jgi:hypothetical protein
LAEQTSWTNAGARALVPCRHAHHAQEDGLRDRSRDDALFEGGFMKEAVGLVVDELKVKIYQIDGLLAAES